MVKYEMRHQQDDEGENSKTVGTRDLRDSFKDKPMVAGTFSLNGFEFRNFQARDPRQVVDAINRATVQSGVTASIDNKGHLVLDNNDSAPIAIKLGPAFEEAPGQPGSVADEVIQKLETKQRDYERERRGAPRNDVLDDLGLEATEDDSSAIDPAASKGSPAYDPARDPANPNQSGGPAGGGTAGAGQTANPTNIPSAPVAETGASQGKLADGRGRTGDGDGYHAKPDGTPAVPGTPENPGSNAADARQAGNPGAAGNPSGQKEGHQEGAQGGEKG